MNSLPSQGKVVLHWGNVSLSSSANVNVCAKKTPFSVGFFSSCYTTQNFSYGYRNSSNPTSSKYIFLIFQSHLHILLSMWVCPFDNHFILHDNDTWTTLKTCSACCPFDNRCIFLHNEMWKALKTCVAWCWTRMHIVFFFGFNNIVFFLK